MRGLVLFYVWNGEGYFDFLVGMGDLNQVVVDFVGGVIGYA